MERLLPFAFNTRPSDSFLVSTIGVVMMVGLNAAVLATYTAVVALVVKVVA